jgi:hypothetical protein
MGEKMVSKKMNFIIIFFLMSGVFIHTFYFTIFGFSFKLRYLTYIIFFYMVFNYNTVKKTIFDIFFSPLLIFFFLITYNSVNKEEHIISIVYLLILLGVSRIIFSNIDFLKLNSEKIYKSLSLIHLIGVISFLYLVIFVGLEGVSYRLSLIKNAKLLENNLISFIFYDGFLPRYNGYILDPNFWGLYVIFGLYIILVLKELNPNKIKYFELSFVLSIISILFTASRGAIITLIGIFMLRKILIIIRESKLICKFNIKAKSLKKLIIVLVLLVILSIPIINYGVKIVDKDFFISRYSFTDLDSSRISVWARYLNKSDNPLIGNGLTRWLRLNSSNFYKTSHNTYIFIYYTSGLIGLFLFSLVPGGLLIIATANYLKSNNYRVFSTVISFTIGVLIQIATIDTLFSIVLWGVFILGFSVIENPTISSKGDYFYE